MIEIPSDIEAIISCDLETTGLDIHGDCWITGSFGKLDPSTLETIDELELKSRPYVWNEDARRIHRISIQTASEFPDRVETLDRLIDWLPRNRKFAFLCHASASNFNQESKVHTNAHFDLALLKMDFLHQGRYYDFYKVFSEHKVISTVEMARSLKYESAKLDNLCKQFNIKLDHHDAKSDRLACEEIFRRFKSNENGLFNVRERSPKLDSSISKIQENSGMAKQQRFGI